MSDQSVQQEAVPNSKASSAEGTKEDLLGLALDREIVTINGKQFTVRGLTSDEEARFSFLAADNTKKQNLNAIMVSLTLETPSGERMFADNEVDRIKKMPGKVVRQIVDTAMKLSGLDETSRKALGKDSGGTEGGDSSSA